MCLHMGAQGYLPAALTTTDHATSLHCPWGGLWWLRWAARRMQGGAKGASQVNGAKREPLTSQRKLPATPV